MAVSHRSMDTRIPLLLLENSSPCLADWLTSLSLWPRCSELVLITDDANLGSTLKRDWRSSVVAPLLSTHTDSDCLCCGLRSELGDQLRRLFLQALADRTKRTSAVLLISRLTNPEAVKLMLKHVPFLAQRYRFIGYFGMDVEPLNSNRLNVLGYPSPQGLEELLGNKLH